MMGETKISLGGTSADRRKGAISGRPAHNGNGYAGNRPALRARSISRSIESNRPAKPLWTPVRTLKSSGFFSVWQKCPAGAWGRVVEAYMDMRSNNRGRIP